MLSKEMYDLLCSIPRKGRIKFDDLAAKCGAEEQWLINLLCEAKYEPYGYINAGIQIKSESISLTEKGQAAIEAYEQAERNDKTIRRSLTVSAIAMGAAIASAVVSVVSLVKMFL